jgi:hypothetical protein
MELKLSLTTLPKLPLEQNQLADDVLVTAFNWAQKCFHLSSKDSGVLKEKSCKTHPSQPAQPAREFLEDH